MNASLANTAPAANTSIWHCYQTSHEGCFGVVLEYAHDVIDHLLRSNIVGPKFTVVFLLMVLHWHVLPKDQRSQAWRLVGRSGLVLQIYGPLTPQGNPFLWSCIIIVADCFVLPKAGKLNLDIVNRTCTCACLLIPSRARAVSVTAQSSDNLNLGWAPESPQALLQRFRSVADPLDVEDKPIKNVYMCVSSSLPRVICTFVVQLCLVICFVWYMNGLTHTLAPFGEQSPDKKRHIDCGKWALAVMIMLISGDGEMGDAYDHAFWARVLHKDEPSEKVLNAWSACCCLTYRREWLFRALLDKIANSMFRTLVQSTAPILLCTEEPLDFVKDCLAICFILKIDDYESPRGARELQQEARKDRRFARQAGIDAMELFFQRVGNWEFRSPTA